MTAPKSFESQFFKLTAENAKIAAGTTGYDIIIVGGGFGGGVFAADLFDKNRRFPAQRKRVLLIERGNLAFTTHCLNLSRSGATGNSGQQNDLIFREFRSEYNVVPPTPPAPKIWEGGPMYTLGGRSNAWGLFIPRPHRNTLTHYFPLPIVTALIDTYFVRAESLLRMNFPETKAVHQRLIDNLNEADGVHWQWGRIASEFRRDTNFNFAGGAYSTVDKLLEIAMGTPGMGDPNQNVDFRILLNNEVRHIAFTNGVHSVFVGSNEIEIKARAVVLCAGSVHSPAILLRSGFTSNLANYRRLTDHAVYLVQQSYDYTRPGITPQEVESMKVQTFTKLGDPREHYWALADFTVDASLFLSRLLRTHPAHAFGMVFILPSELGQRNGISLVGNEPVVTIERTNVADTAKVDAMVSLVESVRVSMQRELGVQFREPTNDIRVQLARGPLPSGCVAHELGSLPMTMPGGATGAVDNDLQFTGRSGVYVCDLSVFPVSPGANPSLTLSALALRLSDRLFPPQTKSKVEESYVYHDDR